MVALNSVQEPVRGSFSPQSRGSRELAARAIEGPIRREITVPYCARLKWLNSSHSMFGPCCWVHKGLSSIDEKESTLDGI